VLAGLADERARAHDDLGLAVRAQRRELLQAGLERVAERLRGTERERLPPRPVGGDGRAGVVEGDAGEGAVGDFRGTGHGRGGLGGEGYPIDTSARVRITP